MTDQNAASAATDTLTLNSSTATHVRWLMQKRVDVMLDLYADRGEWSGGSDATVELAGLVAAIAAIEEAEGDVIDRQLVDIELPSGATFTSYLEADLAAELQRCLDRLKGESFDDARRRREIALADMAEAAAGARDPEATARLRFQSIDRRNPEKAELYRLLHANGVRRDVYVDLRVVNDDGTNSVYTVSDLRAAGAALHRELGKIDQRIIDDWTE